jgi:hypothetical protein
MRSSRRRDGSRTARQTDHLPRRSTRFAPPPMCYSIPQNCVPAPAPAVPFDLELEPSVAPRQAAPHI